MNSEAMIALIAEAAKAPSVHNVQPARWRVTDDGVILFEDLTRRLTVADPKGNDAAISLGAALEGLSLAASRAGYAVLEEQSPLPDATHGLRPVAALRLEQGGEADALADFVDRRQSWRGPFEPPSDADRETARGLGSEDCAVFADALQVRTLSDLVEDASFGFMRDAPFRKELVSWMRLSRRHKLWAVDGLNADAMQLGKLEAWAAGLVLGPAFAPLDGVGAAKGLLSETEKTRSAAAVLVFHRPANEPAMESGRHFYRLWLRIEAAGFGAAVLAALADSPQAAAEVGARAGLSPDRRVVSAFRVGRRPKNDGYERARRPVSDLLV